jgi:hypothetical protein
LVLPHQLCRWLRRSGGGFDLSEEESKGACNPSRSNGADGGEPLSHTCIFEIA